MSAHNLYIKDFNTSIGADLCTGEHVEDCRRGLGGNYSYAITMSKYFPPIYATIEFGWVKFIAFFSLISIYLSVCWFVCLFVHPSIYPYLNIVSPIERTDPK